MVAAGLCRNLPVPYTVLLVVIGLVLGELDNVWPTLAFLHDFQLRPDLVFFVFLPALIFESGYNLNASKVMTKREVVAFVEAKRRARVPRRARPYSPRSAARSRLPRTTR